MASREEHAGAVVAALSTIAALQEHLALATEQADVALGLMDSAVGQTTIDSGRNAMAFLAGCKEKIEEAFGATVAAHAEAERYSNGF